MKCINDIKTISNLLEMSIERSRICPNTHVRKRLSFKEVQLFFLHLLQLFVNIISILYLEVCSFCTGGRKLCYHLSSVIIVHCLPSSITRRFYHHLSTLSFLILLNKGIQLSFSIHVQHSDAKRVVQLSGDVWAGVGYIVSLR